jgi:hypothetical protein
VHFRMSVLPRTGHAASRSPSAKRRRRRLAAAKRETADESRPPVTQPWRRDDAPRISNAASLFI